MIKMFNIKNRKLVVIWCLWMVGVITGSVGGNIWWQTRAVSATDRLLTTTADFDSGKYVNTEAETKGGQLKLKAAGTWNPLVNTVPNVNLGDQAAVTSDGNYIYVMANADNYFARYLPTEDRWETLANAPHYAYPGSDLVVLGNYIYAVFGGYQKEFSRYSIINNSWSEMTMLPDITYGGTSLATNGTDIYCLRGYNTTDFWKYTVASNSWITSMNNPPAAINYGAGLVYSPATNKMYTPRGNSTNTFYIYDLGTSAWSVGPTLPGTMNEDVNIDIGGTMIYVIRGIGTSTFWGFNVGTTSWSTLAGTPQVNRYVGSVYNQSDGLVYVFRGNSTADFWKYNPGTNQFNGVTDLPIAPGIGSDLNYLNGNLYYRRGGSTNIYQNNLGIGSTWKTMATSPATISSDDTKGVVAGNLIYYLRGNGNLNFYNFDPTVGVGGTWNTLLSVPTGLGINYGAGLAYPGSGNYLYATRGGLTRTFMRYTIGVGETWDDVAVVDLPDDAEAGYGSRIIGVGTTELFYIGGHGIARLLKYNITANSWTVLGDLPFSPYLGTDITYYNGKIFAQAGFYKRDFWEYTISTNVWRRLTDVPGYNASDSGSYQGGFLETNGSGTLYAGTGGALWIRNFSVGTSNYPTAGSWTSGIIDLSYVSAWSGLTVGKTTPGDSGVIVNTRTSADRATWSGWQVAGVGISSPAAQYLQVGITLLASSGGSETPIINDLTVSYVGDTGVPVNPTNISGLSQQVAGIGLTSGGSYGYNQPYFVWSGATDPQTSIAGYYVYFGTGTSQTIDPVNDGNFQTNINYLVTTPMETGTYNLLIKTKDSAGNISQTWPAFVYNYNGVSPFISLVQTSTPDFSVGTTTGVDISNNQIRLSGRNGFWQQERLSVLTGTVSDGGGMAIAGNKLYIIRGSNSLYIYDIATDVVSTGPTLPATAAAGAVIVDGPSGYLYALRGGGTSSFWRYNIGTSSWSDASAADTPQPVNQGASMVFDGSQYIYALKGAGDDTFMRYDTLSDNWEVMSANTDFGAPDRQYNNFVGLGGELAIDVGTSKVYAIQGGLRTGFASYDINAGTWSQLTNLPAMAYYGARIEYDPTTRSVFYISGWDKPYLFKYDVDNQTWTQLAESPAGFGYGASMKKSGNYLYFTRGASTATLYKYNLVKNSWVVPNWNLFGGFWRGTDYRVFGDGADIIRGDNNNLYITRGAYDNLFIKYNASTGEVTKLTDIPAGMYRGAELVYDNVNNKIYASTSLYDKKFLVYDVAADSWSQVAGGGGTLPTDPGEGSALVFDGSEFIYRIRGGNTQTFHRFSVNTGLWSTLPNTPAAMQYGADLEVYNNYIYATRGVGTTVFYRFGPLTGTGLWSSFPTVSYLPAGMTFNYDGFLVKGAGDTLYGCRGGNTADCFGYSVNSNTWTNLGSSMPAQITYGGAGAINQAGDKMYAITGAGTNSYSNGLYSYVISTANSAVGESGSYVSPVHDLGSVFRLANLMVGYSGADNTSLVVSTRTSADGIDWNSWAEVSSEKQVGTNYYYRIGSTPKRYLQVKFDLGSGDGIYSGTIDDYTINYYQDTGKPNNPTLLTAYTNSGMGTTTVSGVWNNSTAPYFDWPDIGQTGAADDGDGGSGIGGYYIYFGLGETVDPSGGGFSVGTSMIGTGLTSGNTYYFRYKTADVAGNITDDVGSTFVYKFDNIGPSNPTTITADPPGYTATNSFNFSWGGAVDDGSGIEGYFYKTGAVGVTEAFTVGTSAVDIPAYQTGTNTFYVRTKDAAGNVSAYTTASYYYSSTAPSVPTNLRITYPLVGATNTVNEFAFAWDAPTEFYGQQSGLRYYYTFNELPKASNINEIGLSVTYLSKGAYATNKGTNTLYVLAMDEAGNIDYNIYSSIEFTASTSAPGLVRNIDISDVSIKETSSWRLALSWDAPVASGSGVAVYKIYRSVASGASCNSNFDDDFEYASSTTTTSFIDANLSQSKYYYCAKACDSTNECSAVSDTVGLMPDGRWRVAPSLISGPTVSVKTKSAIVTWSTSRTSSSFVKYGKSSGNYGTEVGTSDQISSHTINLTGLDPGTTYYYQVLWTDEDGNTGTSDEKTFTTNPAPVVSTVKIVDIGLYSAYVQFGLNHATKATIHYGKTVNYGSIQTITTATNDSSYTIKLDSLVDGTKYHLKIVAEDEEANVFSSDDYEFETLPMPKLSEVKVQQVRGEATATIRVVWKSNTGISSVITYYPKGMPESSRDAVTLTLTKNHQMIIKDLLDDSDYVLVIKGKDIGGNEALASKIDFKTSADMRPPQINNLRAETVVTGVGDKADGRVVVSWDTDELASSQVEYGEGTGSDYPSKTQDDPSLTLNHTVTVPDMKPGMVYHLRVVTKDKIGNIGESYDNVVVMPKATKSALDLVVGSLSKSFGFFSSLSEVAK